LITKKKDKKHLAPIGVKILFYGLQLLKLQAMKKIATESGNKDHKKARTIRS
jgi:hypothetical protein